MVNTNYYGNQRNKIIKMAHLMTEIARKLLKKVLVNETLKI